MTLEEFQRRIEQIYLERDRERGAAGTFVWFIEEVGELARAVQRDSTGPTTNREADRRNLKAEFADCLAWLSTLASLHGIRLEAAADKYACGCPSCRQTPCTCPPKR